MIFLKKILDSMEFLSCCSSKTKLSPKTFSKLFSPHDSVRSHSLFTNSCGIFGIIYSTFWFMGSNIFCPQKDQYSQTSKSIKLTWLHVYLMLLRSVFEKLREKGLYISRFLTFIFYTGYTKTMKSIEKLKICSNHIKNLSERNNSTHRMQMRSDIVDITTQVICSDTVTSSHTDANEIRTFVRIDTSAAPVRDWYENRNILSLVGLVITVSVFSALRCIIFSGDVQRVMPLSKSTTTYSLRSSAMSPTTEGADNMKNLAWIYSSEKHDLSAGCSAACSMCGTLLNTPTETREINKPVNKLLNRQLINSIASTKTADNKSYYNAPYPAPTEERFFPSPVEQIESIDTSRGLSSHCQQHDQDGTYECPSGLHSVLDTSSIEVFNSGVSSNMIGEYLDSEYHAVMDIDTGVVSTSTFSAWGKSTGNKVENHQIKIATNIADQGDMILFSVPVIFDYDQRVEKSAFIGFPKNYRNVDYSKSTERPMKRFTIEDAENFTPLKEGPTESPIQYYIDYVANEVVNYKTEKFRTLRDDMKNPTEQIIIALKKAIQYIMSAIQIDLNELKSIVESFTSIVIDGYRTLMKYMEMEFHRW